MCASPATITTSSAEHDEGAGYDQLHRPTVLPSGSEAGFTRCFVDGACHCPTYSPATVLSVSLAFGKLASYAVGPMNILRRLLAAALICLSSACVFAWNETGHRAIGMLAFEQLTPAVRTKISELLAQHPHAGSLLRDGLLPAQGDPELIFANAAKWPDEVRNPPYAKAFHHATWHYVNIPYVPDEYAEQFNPRALKEAGDLLPALNSNLEILKNPKASKAAKAVAICWVAHLVGDIHQPLHTVALYTPLTPKGDKGGNALLVRKTAAAKSVTNLHSIWDSMLGGGSSMDASQNIVSRLKAEHPDLARLPGIADHTTIRSWAEESREAAKTHAYLAGKLPFAVGANDAEPKPEEVPALPDDYLINGRGLADLRAAQAAYRLAVLLNAALAQ